MTAERELLEHFADVGERCAQHGVLDEAFDELTSRVAIHGEWCPHDFRQFSVCRLCGTVQAGGKPEPGGCLNFLGLGRAMYLAGRMTVAGVHQFKYWVLRRDGLS